MLETEIKLYLSSFYSTGMRVNELVMLNESQIDLIGGSAKVRGKGKKREFVPLEVMQLKL